MSERVKFVMSSVVHAQSPIFTQSLVMKGCAEIIPAQVNVVRRDVRVLAIRSARV